MAIHICDICGTDFVTLNNEKRCSPPCKKEGRRRYALTWYHDNAQTVANRNKTYRDTTPERQLLKGAKWRSYIRGEECLLKETDIIIPDKCPIFDVPFEMKGRFCPTLDRIDSSKGYLKDNVWVISKLANVMKSDASQEEQRKFAEWILQQFPKTYIDS